MAPHAAILGCSGVSLGPDERTFLRDADPWGFILFARNIEAPEQVRRLTASLREAVGREAPVLIDQEGGRVSRLRPPHWRDWPEAQAEVVGLPNPTLRAEAMRLRYRLIADELRAVGIDVNCAPLVDVLQPDTHPFLRSRCYAADPAEVAALGRAVAEGLAEGGVLPVVKHVPGHGRTRVDSHADLPLVDADLDALDAVDFAPFRALADLPLAMTAHVTYPAIDPDHPATLSSQVIDAIRTRIGFGGCLITDDVSMGALSGPMRDRAAQAFAAGCDIVLHCNADRSEAEAILEATPVLAGEGAARAERALSRRGEADRADALALAAALDELRRAARAG